MAAGWSKMPCCCGLDAAVECCVRACTIPVVCVESAMECCNQSRNCFFECCSCLTESCGTCREVCNTCLRFCGVCADACECTVGLCSCCVGCCDCCVDCGNNCCQCCCQCCLAYGPKPKDAEVPLLRSLPWLDYCCHFHYQSTDALLIRNVNH